MQLPFDTYGLRRHNGLPLEEFYHSVENVPDLAARGVSQELYRRIFVNELAQVTGLEMPPRDEDAVKRQVCAAWLAAFVCFPVGLPYCCWITHRERGESTGVRRGSARLASKRHRAAARHRTRRRRQDADASQG